MKHNKSPIFIVGHSRSGSTLLAETLGKHKNFLALPETHLFDESYSGNFISRWNASKSAKSIVNYVFDRNPRLADLNVNKPEVLKEFCEHKGPISFYKVVDAIFKVISDNGKKGRIIEKTPFHIEHIDRIFRYNEKSLVICIIRDSRDAIDSLIKVPWTHSNPQRHAAYWVWCVQEAKKFERKYPEKFLLVKYEDLLENSEKMIDEIFQFTSEERDNLESSTLEKSKIFSQWESGWKEDASTDIDSSIAYKWMKNPKTKHFDWSSWTRTGIILMNYPIIPDSDVRQRFRFKPWPFRIIYFLVLMYRTHFVRRGSKFRRKILKQERM